MDHGLSRRRPVGTDAAPVPDRTLPAIILAVHEHRRRTARLLDGVDDLRRAAVEAGVAGLADGRIDVATLLAQFSEYLRAGDGHIETLVARLETHGLLPAAADGRRP